MQQIVSEESVLFVCFLRLFESFTVAERTGKKIQGFEVKEILRRISLQICHLYSNPNLLGIGFPIRKLIRLPLTYEKWLPPSCIEN